jgi:hypothetical protein
LNNWMHGSALIYCHWIMVKHGMYILELIRRVLNHESLAKLQ